MCFGAKPQKADAPPPPPETLKQPSPDKKTDTSSTSEAETSKTVSTPTESTNPLTIGTKKYRTKPTGLSGLSLGGAPSGIELTK